MMNIHFTNTATTYSYRKGFLNGYMVAVKLIEAAIRANKDDPNHELGLRLLKELDEGMEEAYELWCEPPVFEKKAS